ncbi:tripartite tricarboxylate transporter substrate binding protein [Desulfotomaculum sp. 1211_IL3151]|uniref:tripartite tricarboxylate transporter substrate binding protein n=1 Tax=Desulfotomaculum sp. 1211_IL3151 TaxID=3084055 RepID=UPI002FDA5C13
MKRLNKVFALMISASLFAATLVGCSSGSKETAGNGSAGYPEKAIEFVVPFSAGGGSDIMSRTMVKIINDNGWATQPINVINKPGASGSVGYSYVAEKKENPYYIATVSSNFYTAPLLGNSPVSYQQFEPVCGLAMDTLALYVKADSEIKDVKQIVEMSKANPVSLSIGGTGGTSDDALLYHMMQKQGDIKLKYVPFDSGGAAMTALLGGHVDMVWSNPGEALNQVEAGKAKAIAVASAERIPGLESVPTLIEQGMDAELSNFRGIVMPKGSSPEAIKYMEDLFKKVHESEAWQKDYVEKNSVTPVFLNREEFGKKIIEVSDNYLEVFNETGATKK